MEKIDGYPPHRTGKLQAQVLVPLVKALRAELGDERADALVRKALGDIYRRLGEKWWREHATGDLGKTMSKPRRLAARAPAENAPGSEPAQFYQAWAHLG
ncbi:MAG: hypothetical protein IPM01_17485 [Burkholderiaceae bacterium]|nr:hypothetical protein [Burkholderiaceae bacterium]